MMNRILRLMMLMTAAILPGTSFALEFDELTADEQGFVQNYVVGNARFTLLHEVGHMLVDQYKLPVLGREEDAVDAFAAIVMLESQTSAMDKGIAYTSQEWLFDSREGSKSLDEQYADVHSLSKQRGFNITCMMLGKDFDKFSSFARFVNYPENAMYDCDFRYSQMRDTWVDLLAPHVNEDQPSRIVVSSDEAVGEQSDDIRLSQKWIEEKQLLKEAAAMVSGLFKLDMNLRIEAVFCSADGSIKDVRAQNAFWKVDQSTIRYCYELSASQFNNAVSIVQGDRAKREWGR